MSLLPVCFFVRLHRMEAAMIKNPMLIKRITTTGKIKAQINFVPGYKKQLEEIMINELVNCVSLKRTLHYIHRNVLCLFVEQIPGAGLGDPGRAGGYHS